MELAERKCLDCRAGMPTLAVAEVAVLLERVSGWNVENGKFLSKTFILKNFAEALQLANMIGELAEHEGHHPDLLIGWGKLGVRMWTHAVDGLTENDFIMAAKIDRLRMPETNSNRV